MLSNISSHCKTTIPLPLYPACQNDTKPVFSQGGARSVLLLLNWMILFPTTSAIHRGVLYRRIGVQK